MIFSPWLGQLSLAGGPAPVDPEFANVILLLHGEGTNGGTVFTDSSSYNRTITRTGTVTTSTAQVHAGSSSLYFPGSSELDTVDASELHFLNSNFEFDVWLYFTSLGSSTKLLSKRNFYGPAPFTGFSWHVYSGGWVLQLANAASSPSGYASVSWSPAPPLNQWVHVVLTKTGALFTLSVADVPLAGTPAVYGLLVENTIDALTVGGPLENNSYFTGYMDDVIIRANPYPAAVNPAFANVKLLLHMNGTNASTTFTDSSSSPATMTAIGNAQLTTTSPKAGSAAGVFDGNGDCVTVTTSKTIIGTADFCIEMWAKFNAWPTVSPMYFFDVVDLPGLSHTISLRMGLSGKIDALLATTLAGITPLATGIWHHIAVTREGNATRLFINGNLEAIGTDSVNYIASTVVSVGGGTSLVSDANFLDGLLDDFRFAIGAAVYVTNFLPPTVQFPDS